MRERGRDSEEPHAIHESRKVSVIVPVPRVPSRSVNSTCTCVSPPLPVCTQCHVLHLAGDVVDHLEAHSLVPALGPCRTCIRGKCKVS